MGYIPQIGLLSAIWGSAFLLIRISVEAFPPFWVAFLRSAMGASVLWVALRLVGADTPPRRVLPWLLVVAVFNNVVPFTLFAFGEETIQSNTAALINATTPLWTLLFTAVVSRWQISGRALGGVMLGFAGVALVVFSFGRDVHDPVMAVRSTVGAGLVAIAASSYGLATVVAKHQLGGIHPLGLATAQLSIASLVLFPLAIGGPYPSHVQPGSMAAVIVLGVVGSGLAYLLYYRLLDRVSATQVSAGTFLLPLWGIAWGWFAHESMTATAWLGVAVTLSGLVLLNLRTSTAVGHPEGE